MRDTSTQAYPYMPEARRDILFRQVGEEWLLFDPVTGEIHVLNLSAAILWSHCDGTTPLVTVLEGLRAAYGDLPSEREVMDEAYATLEGFRDRGLLVPGTTLPHPEAGRPGPG